MNRFHRFSLFENDHVPAHLDQGSSSTDGIPNLVYLFVVLACLFQNGKSRCIPESYGSHEFQWRGLRGTFSVLSAGRRGNHAEGILLRDG